MSWIKNNWLDGLIFLMVGAIVAGIVFFLTGVNPFKPKTVLVTPEPKPTTQPVAPSRPSDATAPDGSKPVYTVIPSAPEDTAVKADNNPSKPATTTPKTATPPKASGATTPSSTPKSAAPTTGKTDTNYQAPKIGKVVDKKPATSTNIATLSIAETDGDYQVSVGSFSNADNAKRLVTTLATKGYPVRTELSGEYTRVMVGPYSQTRASSVAKDLAKFGAVVRAVPRVAVAQPTELPQVGAQAQTESNAVQVATDDTNAPVPAADVYLQAGAFSKKDNADAVMEKVAALGYAVSVIRAGEVYRVRVGPVDNQVKAKADLATLGLEAVKSR